MLELRGAFVDGKEGASVYNNSIKAGADAIDAFAAKFGILGKIIGSIVTAGAKYVTAVNEQSDKLFATYQQISRVGAAGASGMKGVFQSMQDFGYNIEQLGDFGNLLKANAESLSQFGGTVTQGAQAFAGVAKGLQRTGLQTEFLRLGLTVDDINQGIAGYISLNSRLGATQTKTTKELEQGAAEYLRQQDLLTKLTGKNAQAIENEEKARLSDQQYRVVMRDLEKQAAAGDLDAANKINEIRKAMAQLGPEGQQALKQAMTGFVAAGQQGEKLFRTSGRAFSYASEKTFKASTFLDMLSQDSAKVQDSFGGLARLGQYGNYFFDFAEGADLEAKARAKSFAQQEKDAKTERENQVDNTEAGVKAQVGLRQEQMEATRALQTFINQGVNRTTAAMSKLSGAIEKVTSNIPGTGPDTGTTGTGRGNASSLLDIIGRGESGGNYNALVGGGSANLTGMTIAEVQQLQSTMIKSGRPSTAVGKYQMIAATLAEQVKKAGLDPSKTKFDERTQDLLATQLINQAGYGKKDTATVMKNLAGTWASLPQDMTGRGRYDGYNTNRANIDPNELASALGKSGALAGPTDRYSPALASINTNIPSAQINSETSSALNNARNANDLTIIQIAKMDELIGLMKANNSINSKILQRARN
jgi:muramidase (phage lysozyme)